MIHILLSEEIKKQASTLLERSGTIWPDALKVVVEHPPHPDHGDYSSNIAMQLAKVLKQPPMLIAAGLQELLAEAGGMEGLFRKISAAPPGFLNFYVDWQAWAAKDWRTAPAAPQKRTKVLVEHTSINPNKSAHIGHLRNSCIGDTLARMLARTGCQVEVHNYIDDLGNQLADTVVGILYTEPEQPEQTEQSVQLGQPDQHGHPEQPEQPQRAFSRFGDFCWETYAWVNKEYKTNPALLEKRSTVLHALEAGNSNLAWIGSLVAERIVREQLEEMKQFGIEYDVLVWESSIVREGLWQAAFEMLKRTAAFGKVTEGKLAGCWVLKHREEAEDEAHASDFQADKVLVRGNGILTYTAKDIAYHLWKFGLLPKDFVYKPFADGIWSTAPEGCGRPVGQADIVINVIDHRQEYPQAMVKLALESLGYAEQAARLRHVSYGVVSLSPDTAAGLGIDVSDGKSSYAMSGRQGIGIKVADLLHRMEAAIDAKRSRNEGISSREIAAAAIRYHLLKYNLSTEVVFDLQQATEVTGNSGVYLLYACARASRIMEKAGEERLQQASFLADAALLQPQELSLLRHIAYWPETLDTAIQQLAPNAICAYAFELASLFSHFYSSCPILKGPEEVVSHRLWITKTYMEALEEALRVLGLPTPGQM